MIPLASHALLLLACLVLLGCPAAKPTPPKLTPPPPPSDPGSIDIDVLDPLATSDEPLAGIVLNLEFDPADPATIDGLLKPSEAGWYWQVTQDDSFWVKVALWQGERFPIAWPLVTVSPEGQTAVTLWSEDELQSLVFDAAGDPIERWKVAVPAGKQPLDPRALVYFDHAQRRLIVDRRTISPDAQVDLVAQSGKWSEVASLPDDVRGTTAIVATAFPSTSEAALPRTALVAPEAWGDLLYADGHERGPSQLIWNKQPLPESLGLLDLAGERWTWNPFHGEGFSVTYEAAARTSNGGPIRTARLYDLAGKPLREITLTRAYWMHVLRGPVDPGATQSVSQFTVETPDPPQNLATPPEAAARIARYVPGEGMWVRDLDREGTYADELLWKQEGDLVGLSASLGSRGSWVAMWSTSTVWSAKAEMDGRLGATWVARQLPQWPAIDSWCTLAMHPELEQLLLVPSDSAAPDGDGGGLRWIARSGRAVERDVGRGTGPLPIEAFTQEGAIVRHIGPTGFFCGLDYSEPNRETVTVGPETVWPLAFGEFEGDRYVYALNYSENYRFASSPMTPLPKSANRALAFGRGHTQPGSNWAPSRWMELAAPRFEIIPCAAILPVNQTSLLLWKQETEEYWRTAGPSLAKFPWPFEQIPTPEPSGHYPDAFWLDFQRHTNWSWQPLPGDWTAIMRPVTERALDDVTGYETVILDDKGRERFRTLDPDASWVHVLWVDPTLKTS